MGNRVGGFGCYTIVTKGDGVTWHDANDYCADMGTTLLAIESKDENDAIENYLQQTEGE